MKNLFRFMANFFTPSIWDFGPWIGVYWPVMFSVIVAVSGVFQNMPTMWILAAVALAFGGASTGALRLSEWRERNSVQTKLRFGDVNFVLNGEFRDGTLYLNKIQYSLVMQSVAHFPIRFRIVKFKSKFDNRVHDGQGPSTEGIVLMHRNPQWGGRIIELDPPVEIPRLGRKEGTIEFEIKYGRNDLIKTIRHTIKTNVFIPDNATPQTGWSYADDISGDLPSD